ncbi:MULTISPECIES: sigma-70 family RNA polymerase sigma factor [Sorangium]|uniref:Sigma-70 family RNA polymerase sigma factor n=1 Tax=Sorangium atrum TaxID=2995308 RepID=A0ABT5CHK9_9BACT|nr:sigma-70 family RNA polymerase sigma factor [Sorangium aterium]MDC0685939.1 sigma-70 family RNA polymerase sigma factor [Sorangium aterium]
MTAPSSARRVAAFESCRQDLIALAYRMLGDLGRAEDMVQEAWLRWESHAGDADSPKAYLVTIVTRLCLNELDSARARREESRADRLPEPVDLDEGGMPSLEKLEQVSMAFLVVLQRLTPAERAVLLLHDVFDFDHREIAELVGNNAPACRKLLERARQHLAVERRMLVARADDHHRLLQAFLSATLAGDIRVLVNLLADDAIMITDGGPRGRVVERQRNLPQPLHGAARIAAFIVAATARNAGQLQIEEHELNGQPAIVFWTGDRPFAALLLAVADGKIQRVFFHADLDRLRYLGRRSATSSPRPPG